VPARDVVWVGVQTERFHEMEGFLRAVLGGDAPVRESGFRLWSLPSGDLVELFAPGHHDDFGTGPVVGFAVDDLEASLRAAEAAGAELVGRYGPNEAGYASLHLRAPDGNVYEIVHDPDHERRARAWVDPDDGDGRATRPGE
jgi:catechol 2,3-dioxygenase-like lactoylglutathione lyase family enzyme